MSTFNHGCTVKQSIVQVDYDYFCHCRNPVGKIFPTVTVLDTKPAPEVAVFSSMGPNIITPDIIKVPLFSFLNFYIHTFTQNTSENKRLCQHDEKKVIELMQCLDS